MSHIYKDLKKYGFNTDHSVYTVAEIGINHLGSINIAKRLIDSAHRLGFNAVKFQTYKTEKRTHAGSAIFDILKKCELLFEDFIILKKHAQQYDLDFFSTPFDEESVDFLESIGSSIYKISSFDVENHRLLTKVADTGKSVILSVGMANAKAIDEAYAILKNKTDNIAILHCISAYPTNEEDANLAALYVLREKFDCVIGQSDHTNGIYVPLCAVAAGAQIIEKHYKLDEKMNCPDACVSITEEQSSKMIKEIRKLERVFGSGELGIRKAEAGCVVYRRKNIKAASGVSDAPSFIKKLQWDSDFFGFGVALLTAKYFTEDILSQVDEFVKKENIRLLEYLCNCHDNNSVIAAEKYGFHFTDIRLSFERELINKINTTLSDGFIFGKADKKDIQELQRISENLYKDSRYFFDTNFDRKKVNEFYQSWVERAVLGLYDDECFCLYADKKIPIAFCSLKYHAVASAEIGLFGLSPAYQGKGLGRDFLYMIFDMLVDKKISKLYVVTQGRNYAAQRLYQKAGFLTKATELWYHKWIYQK